MEWGLAEAPPTREPKREPNVGVGQGSGTYHTCMWWPRRPSCIEISGRRVA